MSYKFDQGEITALDAITSAQHIAFAPFLFQTAMILRDCGLLSWLDQQGEAGATMTEITAHSELNEYATGVLLDMALSGHLIYQRDNQFYASKICHYICHDKMTRVNMDFTQHACYQGLFYLHQALLTGKPVGLKVFGDWSTIYPALAELPEPARSSWFAFDHFYSSGAFDAALAPVLALNPAMIYDVGGNTGKWAIRCCQANENIKVTILDLPQQITLAQQAVEQAGFAPRISLYAVDMLTDQPLPDQADIWWMSQFLDCFSPQQIVHILQKIATAMRPDAYLCIMEIFTDTQQFAAAEFCLNATSLYFSCMANGCSRFYRLHDFLNYIQQAGFRVQRQIDRLGLGHTLLICQKVVC